MSKQINQYTKTRTSGSFKDDDYMDFDSTEDSGSTFESAKGTVLNFVNYLKTKITTFYESDGTLTGNRTVTQSGFWARFKGGDVINEMSDEITDHGFIVQAVGQVEKARLGYDQLTASAILKLINSSGTWFDANDGKIKIGSGDAPVAIVDIEIPNGSDIPLSMYENRVGGAILGDNFSLNFYYNDSSGLRTLGGSIQTRVNGTPTSSNVNMDMVLNSSIKLQNDSRVLISDSPLTKAPIAHFEVRDVGSSTGNTTVLFKSGGVTASQIVFWLMNSSSNSLMYIDSTAKHFHNVGKLSTGDFQISAAVDTYNFYSNAGTENIGMGTNTPNSKAKLEVSSTTQGFLPPRMTTTQRDAITSVPAGLTIYNTTTNKMNFYNGSAWEAITSA